MPVRIVTDSASDIPLERAEKWGIKVLPLLVRFGEEEFLDGVTLSNREFYERLSEKDVVPKTSQIPPYEFQKEFEAADSAGDELIYFSLSSGVSGSYQSACMAASEFSDRIHVVDTGQFCISEQIIVQRAVILRDQGMSAGEILEKLGSEIKRAHVISIFDTLEYLKLGGRLSSTAAFAGNILMLKPVITIEDGLPKVIGKARGTRNGHKRILEFIENTGGIDKDMPVCMGYTGTSDEKLMKFKEASAHLYEGIEDKIEYSVVGATIGTYAGPDAFALAYFEKEKNEA